MSQSLTELIAGWEPPRLEDLDVPAAGPLDALGGLLDWRASRAAGAVPPLWHWLSFLSWPAGVDLGTDGHPLTGPLMPPIPDRTRMFAGGRLEVAGPLTVGQPARRRTAVTARTVKQGRTGELAFVTVRTEIDQHGSTRVVEEQDLVYRQGAAATRGPLPAGDDVAVAATVGADPWQRSFRADTVTLFRFSALTANSHRIHYDSPYATAVEGYPGLVVHGPLLALLMLDLAASAAGAPETATYRFVRPVFCGEEIVVSGAPVDGGVAVRVVGPEGSERATATVLVGISRG